MIFCNLINSTGYFYRCKLELDEYIKLLQIILVHTLNYNFSYVLYEELVQKYVRLFFRIRDIPRNQPELINEIINQLQIILKLPKDYALTFNNNSQNQQKLCYNIFFPVNIELMKINNLIDKFNFLTKNKYCEYIKKNELSSYINNDEYDDVFKDIIDKLNKKFDYDIIINNKNEMNVNNVYELKTYHIRTVNSGKIEYNNKYKNNNCRIIHNCYKLIHGNIEDTIIQNCDSLVLYNNNCIKYYEYTKLHNYDENNFKIVLSKKQKRNKLYFKHIDNSLLNYYFDIFYNNNFIKIINIFNYDMSYIKERIEYLKNKIKEFQEIERSFIIYGKKAEEKYLEPIIQRSYRYSRYHPYNKSLNLNSNNHEKTLKDKLFEDNHKYRQELYILESRLKIIDELNKRNLFN